MCKMGAALAHLPGKKPHAVLLVLCEVLLCRHHSGLVQYPMNKACGFAPSVTHATVDSATSICTLGLSCIVKSILSFQQKTAQLASDTGCPCIPITTILQTYGKPGITTALRVLMQNKEPINNNLRLSEALSPQTVISSAFPSQPNLVTTHIVNLCVSV